MTFHNSSFDMNTALNKLRQIEKEGVVAEKEDHSEPGMEHHGKQIDDANFTRLLGKMAQLKDAVGADNFSRLRAGIRSLHMNRRPTLSQMSALLDLLETILGYVADDQTLFQRLKYDLKQDGVAVTDEPEDKEDTADSELASYDSEIEDNPEEDEELVGDEPRSLK